MKNEEYISHGFGLVLITDEYKELVETLSTNQYILGRTILTPGTITDLDGYFNLKPALYVGEKEKYLYFYLGEDSTLLHTAHYFLKIFWVTETRFFMHLVAQGGRDFNFINGRWDWERIHGKRKKVSIATKPNTFKARETIS